MNIKCVHFVGCMRCRATDPETGRSSAWSADCEIHGDGLPIGVTCGRDVCPDYEYGDYDGVWSKPKARPRRQKVPPADTPVKVIVHADGTRTEFRGQVCGGIGQHVNYYG